MVGITSFNIVGGSLEVAYSYAYRMSSTILKVKGTSVAVSPSAVDTPAQKSTFTISSWDEGSYRCYLDCTDEYGTALTSDEFLVKVTGVLPPSATLDVSPTSINVTDVNQNEIEVSFTSSKALTDVEISFDNGATYKAKKSMTQTSAKFDITNMNNANYNCKLKGTYNDVVQYGNVVTDVGLSVLMVSGQDIYPIGIKLDKAPSTNQTVTVERYSSSSDLGFGVESNASITFTPSNWNTYQYSNIRAAYWTIPADSFRHLSIINPNGEGKLIAFYRP